MIRQNILEYGVAYLNYDYKFDKEGKFEFNIFPLYGTFYYSNFEHDQIRLDLNKFAFNFTTMARDGKEVLFVAMPLIQQF